MFPTLMSVADIFETESQKALIFMHRIPTREVFADREKLCGRKVGKNGRCRSKSSKHDRYGSGSE